MKVHQANALNSISLILLGFWGYFDTDSVTALIPVGFGLILFFCNSGIKKENKIISHLAVLLTLVILIALVGMRLPKSLESGGFGLYRVLIMIITSTIAIISFVHTFIKVRQQRDQ